MKSRPHRVESTPLFPNDTERKFVSVLFADLCSSTAQIADLDPEEAKEYLERALMLMSQAIHAYGGIVSQVLGDGLIALFGAPIAQEDHALRACLAAIDIQKQSRLQAGTDQPMVVRIGIHSGEVVVGPARDDIATFYRADGSTIHLASRVEQLAQPGTVLISDATWRLINVHLHARSRGHHPIRGLERKLELFELALSNQRALIAAPVQRGNPSPLIGRTLVLAAMMTMARNVLESGRRAIGLRGEAGIGKSRLIAEFSREASSLGYSVCQVSAQAWSGQTPYRLIAELFAELMNLPLDADSEQRAQQARILIGQWPAGDHWHADVANELLGLGEQRNEWRSLTPIQRSRQITQSIQWLITLRQSQAPLLIIIDDLHLADQDSVRLLNQLLPTLNDLPVMLCLGYRPVFTPRWDQEPWFVEQAIESLPTTDSHSLAQTLLGNHPSVADLVDMLVTRTDGNPLFVEQIILALVDEGTLLGHSGAYQQVSGKTSRRLPGTITAIIGARIDRLPAAAKSIVEAAAVVAEPISVEIAATMQAVSHEEAGHLLSVTVAAGVMSRAIRAGREVFQFTHGLMQEVAVGSLTARRRQRLHREAHHALRTATATLGADPDAVLANHAWHGELWEAAAGHAQVSMRRSIARSANRAALKMYELGLDAIGHLTAGPDVWKAELGLRLTVLGALLPTGKIDEIVVNLEHAESIAARLGNRRQRSNALLQLALTHWIRGSYRKGLDAAGKAMVNARDENDNTIGMAALQLTMMLNHGLGRYPEVVTDAQQLFDRYSRELSGHSFIPGWAMIASVNAACFLADAYWRMGEMTLAQQFCNKAYLDLREHDHPFSRTLVDFTQAEIWLAQDRPGEAAALLESTVRICHQHEFHAMLPAVLASLAGAMALAGQPQPALQMLHKALADRIDLAGGRYNAFYYPKNMALAQAMAGDFASAIQSAAAARAASASFEQHGQEAESLLLQAEIEAMAGDADEAQQHHEQALGLCRACGASPIGRGLVGAARRAGILSEIGKAQAHS